MMMRTQMVMTLSRAWPRRVATLAVAAGVRYGAAYVRSARGPILVATGPSGFGLSRDDGAGWTVVDSAGYNTVAAAPSGGALWLAGVGGRIAKLVGSAHRSS